jgi:hypothetical protein
MKMTPLRDKMNKLRAATKSAHLDSIERMLNASKGLGTTPRLVEKAIQSNLTLIVHSEPWADKLREANPGLKVRTFNSVVGGEPVLIDNGVNWLLLREAQALLKLSEDLLNWMEHKKIGDA